MQFKELRRDFITLVSGAATWPLAARAPAIPVIGFFQQASRAVAHLAWLDFGKA